MDKDDAKIKSPTAGLGLQSKGEAQHLPRVIQQESKLSFTRRSVLERRINGSTYKMYKEEKVWLAGSKSSSCTHRQAHRNGLAPLLWGATGLNPDLGLNPGPQSLEWGRSCRLPSAEPHSRCEPGVSRQDITFPTCWSWPPAPAAVEP